MTLSAVFRVIRKNIVWLLLFPAVITGTVAYLTRSLPRTFVSEATVYTGFASGLSIVGDDSQTSTQEVNNAFDNLIATIKSRETMSEVGLRLLAYHLSLTKPSPDQLGQSAFDAVQALRGGELAKAVVGHNERATLQNLNRLAQASGGNVVKRLLYQSATPYAVDNILGRVTITRRSSSDMLELSCKGEDPAICQQTLVFLIDTFRRRYKVFRSTENGTVVKYFENQALTARTGLRSAEDKLTDYGIKNKIINYGEQSKFTAEAKETTTLEYDRERMQQQAARAALNTIEGKLEEYGSLLMANSTISNKRTELGQAQTKLANAMLYEYPPEQVAALRRTTDKLSSELKVAVRRLYNSTNTLDAIPRQALIDDYINQMLKFQESSARLGVLAKRVQGYSGIYQELAPQGSAIHRLEREVDLAEREYLSVLHGLNMARLRQKNLEMTGSMNVLDTPSLPMKPQPSIRAMLVVLSFVAGLVLLLSFLLGREFLNGGIRSPDRAEQLLNMPLAAAFPVVSRQFRQYDLAFVEQCMTEQLRSSLLIETPPVQPGSRWPYRLITLWATRDGQGKTWVGERISRQLVRAGHRVCYLYPDGSARVPDTEAVRVAYPIQTDFADTIEAGVLLQLLDQPKTPAFDYVILELPGLLVNAIPVHLVAQSDLSLLVVHAETVWKKADQALSTLYQKAAKHPIMAVLNYVEPDLLEPILGKIPKSNARSEGLPKQRFLGKKGRNDQAEDNKKNTASPWSVSSPGHDWQAT